MGKYRPNTKGYMYKHEGKYYVGASDESSTPLYRGPEARVTADDTWLNIRVDSDSHVMLDVETIPYLIKSLQKLQKSLKKISVDSVQN